jgi:hypothetical protein
MSFPQRKGILFAEKRAVSYNSNIYGISIKCKLGLYSK